MARRWLVPGLLVLLVATSVAETREERERTFRVEIEATSPDAAKLFVDGETATREGRAADAIAAYTKAIELAPKSDHLHRGLCTAHAAMRAFDDALQSCERAIVLARGSTYNVPALVEVLLARNAPTDRRRALQLSDIHAQAWPGHPLALGTWCRAINANETGNARSRPRREGSGMGKCLQRWLAAAPDDAEANFFAAALAADDGEYEIARAHLAKATQSGLDQALHDSLVTEIEVAEKESAKVPAWRSMLWIGFWVIAIWLFGLLAIYIVGLRLSIRTLVSIERKTEAPVARYKRLLGFAGVYFYLSIPIAVATILAMGGVAMLAFLATDHIKTSLVLTIGAIIVAILVALLRGLLFYGREAEPGKRLDLAASPKLRTILDDVAHDMGTRPVVAMYLAPTSELAIVVRGSVWSAIRNERSPRMLVLGEALLDSMSLAQFRAALARAYGRFIEDGSAGGGTAHDVLHALMSLIARLAAAGVATGNPVAWFVRGFAHIYATISLGARRLQHVIAERAAAGACQPQPDDDALLGSVLQRSDDRTAVAVAAQAHDDR